MKDGWAFLWKEKVSKLLLKFSIPCIISFIVNALYNIVDQIFIWRGIDYLANGATNIVFPLMMVCLWFALLFWDWSASYLSLKLWEKKKEEAAKWVANGISMSVLVSVVFAILWYLFLPQLLNLFWCTDALRDYAMTYGSIIMLWVPFVMIWVTLNSIIRADWNPKFAMLSMIAWAVINTILDWWFIFGLGLWMAWAAYATIISQFITFVLNAWYVSKLNTVSLTRKSFHIDFWTTAKIMW
jgi:Na+-driven multidrug efflux pump